MSLPLHTLTTPQAVSSALANLSLALLASSTANTPTARAALRAELQCVDDSSTPCAAAAVHPLRGEYCKLLRGRSSQPAKAKGGSSVVPYGTVNRVGWCHRPTSHVQVRTEV